MDFVNKLNPVSYVRKNSAKKEIEYGFIAQEIEETFGKFGISANGVIKKDDEGMYSVRYNDFIPITVKAVQELSEENEILKTQLESLESSQESLQKENEELKAQLEEQEQRLQKLEKLFLSEV